MSWLLAMAPDEKRASLEAWSSWLKCLVLLTNVEWSESARKDALDAYGAGRTARVPCGPPPTTLCQKDAVLGWFEWAAQGSSTRFEVDSWKAHTFESVSYTHLTLPTSDLVSHDPPGPFTQIRCSDTPLRFIWRKGINAS